MYNPFVKLVSKKEEPSVEEEVETTFDNHGDYYEFTASRGGKEIKRQRAESLPDDRESLEKEYKQFRRDVGAIEESDLNI
jgi:hypothetical protein